MKYYEVDFNITPYSEDAADVLSALAAEAGFETFQPTGQGLTGYVQQALFDREALDAALQYFPFEGTTIYYNVREAEDRDWNEQWEQEGFEPIVVGHRLTIHDGRHLPTEATPLAIEIDARMAFGTGTHETTRMICKTLLGLPLEGARMLDCGSGTGILGIAGLLLGAKSCMAYDIDEWSTDNTRHNSVINHVDERMTALTGDAALLDGVTERFDVVTANINRNILLQDMPRFRQVMAPKATLILSGFYQADEGLLTEKAQTLGLTLQETLHDGDWACLVLAAH